ncbi:hypothetical protein WQ57_23750 [Mesobacillus campisalis]|uniref:DUF4030 domain-containing protein n=1 Tax=Mesobacillus campisalis TaxID=1408103 RepID=A0A0M2SLZ5_9BACI|nr:DUF4030 domain-containing protein [Mesobacillus campisalis]KKK33630.1 hypothetical protein WQ57_23750 [Mesobacillus campisalis]
MDPFKYPKGHPELKQLHFDEKNKQRVWTAVKTEDLPIRKAKNKLAISGIAAAALLALLIGTANFTPAMVKVAAKIPYFSVFIKQEEYKMALNSVVFDVLNGKPYDLRNLKVSVPKKEITIWFGGTKAEVKAIEEEIVPAIDTSLKENNFGSYKIEVIRDKVVYDPVHEGTPEEEKYTEDSMALRKSINEQLERHNYELAFPVEARINSFEKYIYVAIPKTETRLEELEELLHSTAAPYGSDFKLDIRKIDMAAREQEIRWDERGIMSILAGGLMENKEFKVKGFSYSFHPLPLQIKIKTSVKSTDPQAREIADRIEEEIATFIQTDEVTKNVRSDPYEVIILGKDKKQIN